MVLQTLFALSSLFPGVPAVTHITIHGGRVFTAEVFAAKHVAGARDSKYPGAVVIATEETKDRAFLVANRLTEIGVTVMMYAQEDFATYKFHLLDARAAIDSMRRRADVRPEEIGVVAFEEATDVVPELTRDTSLSFAIAATLEQSVKELSNRYAQAHAATLLLQGVSNPGSADSPGMSNVTTPPPTDPKGTTAPPKIDPSAELGGPSDNHRMAANVTVWPVSKDQLENMGEAHSPLGARVVSWVKEQVHATPVIPQLPTVNTH